MPFRLFYQKDLSSKKQDVIVRISLAEKVTPAAVKSFHSELLPFFISSGSGAWSGSVIPPWESGIEDWNDEPVLNGATMDWQLKSVLLDRQAWVVLAQLLLEAHKKNPITITTIEVFGERRSQEMISPETGMIKCNPYPDIWGGVDFSVDFEGDLSKTVSVVVTFIHSPSDGEQEQIKDDLFSWAVGLAIGAYGVAQLPSAKCKGIPDEEVIFIDNEMEWAVTSFRGHSGAFMCLINTLAAISHKYVKISSVCIE